MMTAIECLTNAAHLDGLARASETHHGRAVYAEIAADWRENAILALDEEKRAARMMLP